MEKSARIKIASLIILAGFVFSVFFHYWQGVYNAQPYPASTFLNRGKDGTPSYALPRRGIEPTITAEHTFGDLFISYVITSDRNPYATTQKNRMPSSYLPFAHAVILPITWFDYNTAVAIYLTVAFVGMFLLNVYWLKTGNQFGDFLNSLIFTFLSYPVLFTIDRGNIEPILLFMLAGFIYCYQKKSLDSGAVMLGGAIAMKIYPGVLLAVIALDASLKISERVRFVLVTAAVVVGLTLFSSMLWVGGITQAIAGFHAGIVQYSQMYDGTPLGMGHGTSLYPLLRYIRFLFSDFPMISNALLAPIANYKLFGIGFLALLLATLFLPKMERWERISILVLAVILIPQISYDYRLIWVFIPFWLFLNSQVPPRYGLCMTILFALLMIPKAWAVIGFDDVTTSVVLNPILVLITLAVIIARNMLIWRQHRRQSLETGTVRKNPVL